MSEPIIIPPVEMPLEFADHGDQVQAALEDAKESRASFLNQAKEAFEKAGQLDAGQDEPEPEPVPVKPAPAKAKAQAKPAPAPAPAPAKPTPAPAQPSDSLLPAPPSLDEPAPADPDQADPFALPEDLDKITLKGREQGHWARLKQNRAELAEQHRKLAADYQALQAKAGQTQTMDPALAETVKALQAERDQIRTQLEAVALERSPRFQQQFQPRLQSAVQLAQDSVGPDQAARVQTLLAMPASDYRDQALDEIASGLSGIRQAKFGSAVAEVDKLTLEKQQLLAQAKPVLDNWRAQEKAQQDKLLADREQVSNQAFDQARQRWSNTPLLKDDGSAESKALVAKNQSLTEKIFRGQLTHAELADAAHWAAFGAHSANQMKSLMAENAQLKAQMAKLGRADAGLGTDAGGQQTEDVPETGLSFSQAVARAAAKAGLR